MSGCAGPRSGWLGGDGGWLSDGGRVSDGGRLRSGYPLTRVSVGGGLGDRCPGGCLSG
jgi:hypothetical protein